MLRSLTNGVLALVLLGCAVGAAQAQAQDRTVVLQLRWFHQFQFAGYYVARELGYYADAGLDVEIRAGAPGISPVSEVVGGRADFGIDNSGLLKARSLGKPVQALAAIFQKSAMRFIMLEDSDIDDARDLAGRKIMLLPDYGSLALVALLDQLGLDESIERLDSSHRIDDLVDGKTEVFNGYISNEPYLLEKRNIPYRVIDPASYGIQFYSDVLFTREQMTRQHPDKVRAFTRASLRGWQFALEHPREAIEITRHYAPDKSPDHLRFEANAIRDLVMPDLVKIGHMNPLRWLKIQDQLVRLGLVHTPVDIDDFVFDINEQEVDWRQLSPYFGWIMAVVALLFGLVLFHMIRNQRLQREVAASREEEARAYDLATHDTLTGLPNRLLLLDRLGLAIERARRDRTFPMVAFVDIDNFKQVNDQQGHDRGDALLQAVARHVSACKRVTDTFARLAGDEFVLLGEHGDAGQAGLIAGRMRGAIDVAIAEVGVQADVGSSIGVVVIASADDVDPVKVLKLADLLMYEVKRSGKHGILVREYRDAALVEPTTGPSPGAARKVPLGGQA
ncbi:MAG: ABC transporter substrate-binding protein [Gammaproteobacteria bacterium]|nr:ABC transporter substrate-binding protein [Gammaproteobacteria bacterium]